MAARTIETMRKPLVLKKSDILLDLLDHGTPQQAARADEEDDEQDGEGDGVLVAGVFRRHERLGQADDQPADDRPRNAAQPAEHNDRQALESEVDAEVRP